MKPRAFVVMPFGIKPFPETAAKDSTSSAALAAVEIDFDAVYNQLLKPALSQAGFHPFRADSEMSSGEIRADMFFELVTADLVVADISIPNPNVFYELGIRHGVCPHGILPVQSEAAGSRAFDVAPDRTFRYYGGLFTKPSAAHDERLIAAEIERITRIFERTWAGERENTASPVYEHLRRLVPVNWDNIETAKGNYSGALRADWLDRIRLAQAKGYPGDIKTLADDAPTINQQTKILFESACALIDLCRYGAAERQLREVLRYDSNHAKAQFQLGRVLLHQGKTAEATQHLNAIALRQHADEPHAADLLGQVYRALWHLSWHQEKSLTLRQQKANETSQRAADAVSNFLRAHRADPGSNYYAGFNALILLSLLHHLQQISGQNPVELNVDLAELITVVKFCARNAAETARGKGDSVEEFLATTTLSGIALLSNDVPLALRHLRNACNIEAATFLQVQTLQERLLLLGELDFQPVFLKSALETVDQALAQKKFIKSRRVFLWAGYPLDQKDQLPPRLPESRLEDLQKQIAEQLNSWQVAAGDLAICEGTHEGDILFAEACLEKGASVRLMILEPPEGQPHANRLWPFPSEQWRQRFHKLRGANGVEVCLHRERLGSAFDANTPEGIKSLRCRHQNWLMNTAAFEAEPAINPSMAPVDSAGELYGLFLCDESSGDSEDPEDPCYLMQRVNAFDDYEGEVKCLRVPADEPCEARNESASA